LRWAAANRLAWVAGGWLALLAVVALAGNASLTAAAARAGYLLLAVYAVQLLSTETGQPTLGHAAFLALGAYLTAALRLRVGLDGLLSATLACAAGGAAGWLAGWGAARLRPSILALLTWSFGWLVYVAMGAFPAVTGGVSGVSLRAPLRVRWPILGIDFAFNDFGHLLLGSTLLALLLFLYRSAQGSAVGRGWAAIRDSRTLASSLGYDVPGIRRWTFATSAGVTALAGSLGAQLLQVVDPSLYNPVQSLNLYVAVLIGAPLGFFGPMVGAAVASGAPAGMDALGQLTGLPLSSGRQLATAALVVLALGLSTWVTDRRAARAEPGAPPPSDRPAGVRPPGRRARPRRSGDAPPALLEARDLRADFGGVRALDGVSLSLTAGEVHGLIGPNGSGKSTLLRVLSGTLAAGGGAVTLESVPIDHLDEAGRVRAGITRTFQRTAIMPHLRALAHVEVGLHTRLVDAAFAQALLKSPAYRAEVIEGRREAARLLEVFGLEGSASALPLELSSGRQRLLQMATAMATRPRVLLLDEPAAGMSADEIALLHSAISRVAAAGVAILLIEHNMRFVAGVATRVTVLDGGRVLASGTPAEVSRNPEVRRVYLGVSGGPRPTRRSPPGRRRR
jgi:ABC-type branched-subunit amino acid transport system ATPase component/ABC-type branched-subunit amino acid transport system permease subunit